MAKSFKGVSKRAINGSDGWIQTYCGVKFFPLQPKVEDILLPDIAHALSNQCRYGGHCRKFYSVAQHSVMVSGLVQGGPHLKLAGLLHDATEAYLVDVPRPVKRQIKEYARIEHHLAKAIAERFGLDAKDFESIKAYDNQALLIEALNLLAPVHPEWLDKNQMQDAQNLPERLEEIWTPERSEAEFLERFHTLWFHRKDHPDGF